MDPKSLTIISSVRSLFFIGVDIYYMLTEKFSQRVKEEDDLAMDVTGQLNKSV